MDESITIDEAIIKMVQDNKFLYDKTHVDHKNSIKKKETWKMISLHLENIYNIHMSAENIEKRWSTLRDMFGREERRKKKFLRASGSNESKDWHRYASLRFLSPHIAPRKSRRSFVGKPTEASSSKPSQQTFSQVPAPMEEYEITVKEEMPETWISSPDNRIYYKTQLSDRNESRDECITDLRNALSSASASSESSSSPKNSKIQSFKLKSKKIKLPVENFADYKKEKGSYVLLDEKLANTLSEAASSVTTLITRATDREKEKDGYLLAIEEGFKHVPAKDKTQCIIEVLHVIKKFEVRN